MAKKKGKKKVDLIDDTETLEQATKVEADLLIGELKLKGSLWTMKALIGATLEQTYRSYEVTLSLDESPLQQTIDKIKSDLENGLFADDATAKKNAKKSIERHEGILDKQRKECEVIEFLGFTQEMKHVDKGTQLVLQIPDTAVEPINRQKGRMKLYKIALVPKFI